MLDDAVIAAIAAKVGTPFYVYDCNELLLQSSLLQSAFAWAEVFYSIKANPNVDLCRLIASQKFGAEVSSEFEILTALESHFDASSILVDGPAKDSATIATALRHGIRHFNSESAGEIERIQAELRRDKFSRANLCLRINPSWSIEATEQMGGVSSQFGVDQEHAQDVIDAARRLSLQIQGLHVYTGSQITSEEPILENFWNSITLLLEMSQSDNFGQRTPILVFGLGLGIPYDDSDFSIDIDRLSASLRRAKDQIFPEANVKLEMGRAVVGTCGSYVTSVVDTKESRGNAFVIVDGGIHHFMRHVMTGANHRVHVVGSKGGPRVRTAVVGATCTPLDVLTRSNLERVQEGDMLVLQDAGAYGWSMGLANFLSRPTAPEILVLGDTWTISRQRSTFEKQIALTPTRAMIDS